VKVNWVVSVYSIVGGDFLTGLNFEQKREGVIGNESGDNENDELACVK